ncbi:hypothetical protein H4R18_003868 [Coemansia javaensis]|uniref:Uncharacterized protein n=1 Tax=Coemansia javaensis TaxID=2761396 RepID=A0A9W8H7D5_9FUNG|nr:hypothetical protein H4R18_003868 [Coemansia javaensis]
MKLLATLALAALALTQVSANNTGNKCHPVKCYTDKVPPPGCKPYEPCAAVLVPVTVCPTTCGKPLPKGCAERCKPCPPGKVCAEICECESVCPKPKH